MLQERFEKNLDFFQVDPRAEIRKSVPDFLAFFKKFAKDIEDNLPKINPKKKRWLYTTLTEEIQK